EDGGSSYVTVNLKNDSKKVGGLNPDNDRFLNIRQSITGMVDEDEYAEWREEVEEHIWEHNSLHTNEKKEYSVEGPFNILSLEHYSDETYYHNISIDLDGNLMLYVSDVDDGDSIDADAPMVEKELTEAEVEHIQDLIQEHFWKLNTNIINPDGGNLKESITVNLTERSEERRVGKECRSRGWRYPEWRKRGGRRGG